MSINPVDPKWLEILKASGWQTTALTLACIVIVVLIKQDIIPTDNSPLWVAIPSIFGLIFGFLSLAAIGDTFVKAFKPNKRFMQWLWRRNKVKEVSSFMPYMTDDDRKIIGYLLYHKQKTFQADSDGGYAAPLISKGVISIACKQGQVYDPSRTPFEIPDYIWQVLEQNKSSFPYKPPKKGETEKHPWAIPWMVR